MPSRPRAHTEVPRRLTPTAEVARDLYLRSGNRCAFPGCVQALMTADGILVGEIAHIEAALPSGPRFRAEMTNEQRRAFDNLLLLCGTHHTIVDVDVRTWTVETLQNLKRSHETVYTGAIDRLRSTVSDVTEGTTWQPATNLKRLDHTIGLAPAELAVSLGILDKLAERLAALPVGARSLLAVIVSRGKVASMNRHHEVAISLALLQQIVDCSRSELGEYIAVLEDAGFTTLDAEFAEVPEILVRNSTQEIGWPVMAELHDLAAGNAALVRQVIVDLNFTAFDA
jgi:hypothetical protein